MRTAMLLTVGACAVVTLISGCRNTQVAGVRCSQEEAAWEETIRRNYPNYRAPRAAAPADSANTETRVSAPVENNVKPENDPGTSEAEETKSGEVKPEAEAKPEEAKPEEVKPEAEAKPEEAKPEAKTEPPRPEAEAKTATPPDPTNSTVYEVRSGDTLGKIAQKHYGNARYANVIFKANGDILKDPNRLRPGMKLIVPKL